MFTGYEIQWNAEEGKAQQGQQEYANDIDTKLSEKEKRRKFSEKDLELSKEDEINVTFKEE